MRKEEITGYNANKFVSEDHIFIKGEGTWFFRKEDSMKSVNGNSVGVRTDTKEIAGYTLYKTTASNIWD